MIEIAPTSGYTTGSLPDDTVDSEKQESNYEQRKPDRPRILVVDDERLIANTVCDILTGAGFEVLATYDGMSAIEVVNSFQPDYLLTDVLMPQMNGIELAIEIRRTHPLVEILLFSGQAGISEILNTGQLLGFEFELIAKPIHPLKLIERFKCRG